MIRQPPSFDPPRTRPVYDIPPVIVSSPCWPRVWALVSRLLLKEPADGERRPEQVAHEREAAELKKEIVDLAVEERRGLGVEQAALVRHAASSTGSSSGVAS